MDGILSSKDSVAVDSEQANALTDSNSKSRSSSKRRSKSRSKVWEKVAWFTRKTKGGRENKSESPKGARKEQKSPTLNGKRGEECIDTHNRLNALDGNTSPDLCKTKTKSGVRKTRSFNYLKRKKLKHYANEASSTILDENGKENADPSSGQTATGTFHDFASAKRSSRIAATSGILVSEMAKELNCKQNEQVKESMKSSLSLPLSLLSLSERPENLVCKSCQGLPKGLPLDSNSRKSFSGPNYNSWPRKKRLLVANQSYEAFSPPQKQKRTFGLRKTATFSGFDSTKLCINYSNKAEKRLQGVKSTPLLSGQNQIIKNQNGLTIGVIHFFKSPRNYSNISSMITNDKRLARSLLTDELEKLESCENSTEHPNNEHVDKDSVDIPNIVKAHLDLKSKNTGSNDELLSRSNSKQEFFSKNKQCCSLHSDNIDNISEELGECSSTGTVESVKESLIVEDPVNDMCSLPFKDPSKHLENSCQTDLLDNGCQQLYVEDSCTSSEAEQKSFESSSSEARDLDLTLLISSQKICETDRRAEKLEMIEEVPYSLSEVNTENTEFSGEYSEFNKLQKGLEKDMNSLSHPKETGIYCIKIEDQVTDFSKEAKMDFQSQAKLQPSSTFLDPFIERSNTYIKETPLFQSANNLKPSDTLCVMNNSFKIEPEHRTDSAMLERSLNPLAVRSMEPSIARTTNYVSNTTSLKHTLGEYHEGEDQNNSMLKNTLHLSSQKLLKGDKPRINGPQFKDQTQTILEWFSKFNDEQKNILIKKLLEQCDLPQMHLLSVVMEPVLHKTCPSNCQDMLAWLPHPVTKCVMSYLDPESLCRCSQVNRFWNSLASNHLTWKRLCKSNEWQLSRKTEEKQLLIYTLPCGTVQWKKMFAERYLLRRNWLNGRCKVRTFEGHTQGISCVQFDDTRIVSGSTDKTIKVWDLSRDDSHAVLTLAGHSGTVRCLNLNGNRLVSGSVDRSIKVWDLSFESYWSGASCKVTMVGHMHTVRCLQVDDEKVLSGSYDKTLKVWDIKTGQCKLTLRGHNAAVLCVQFDDSKIVSGSYDNTIKVWSLQEGDCLMTLSGHHDAVTCLNLTQDGRKVISGSLDHNLKFWDLATGKCIGTLDWIRSEGHTGVIRCLQSDSWRIVSAGDDKTLKMWSLETGQRLLTLRCHTDGVTCLQFNDYRIVSGSYDKTVKVWNFSPKHEFLNPL